MSLPAKYESMSFHPPAPNWRSRWVLRPILAAVVIFVSACLAFNSPEIFLRVRYDWSSHTPTNARVIPSSAQAPATSQIVIPGINVTAPVVYAPSLNEADILTALENGVVHYATTAIPGQPGNVVIFGHSSDDWWKPGNYKFVFVLLDKLSAGDTVTVDYHSQSYTYVVTGSQVVAPTDVSVLMPTAVPTLTLITCSPVGTSLRRLVVTARQVSPAPGTEAVSPVSPANLSQVQTLVGSPGLSTSFWNLVTLGWSSVFH
jgi:LPXTG-site transpeptidase (sortase) family protein